jgi:hypothetical protein
MLYKYNGEVHHECVAVSYNIDPDMVQVVVYGLGEELVSWISDEWEEDNDVFEAIKNAIRIGTEKGAHSLASVIGKEWDEYLLRWVIRGSSKRG